MSGRQEVEYSLPLVTLSPICTREVKDGIQEIKFRVSAVGLSILGARRYNIVVGSVFRVKMDAS